MSVKKFFDLPNKLLPSVYIVFIQIQEHCHNVVTTVSDVRRNDLGAGKSCLLSECCPHIWPGAGAGRGEEERASCRGNQAAGGIVASDTAYHRCSAGNWATQTTSQTSIRQLV